MNEKEKRDKELQNELQKEGLSEFVNKNNLDLTPEEIQALVASKSIELKEKERELAEEKAKEAEEKVKEEKREKLHKKIRNWIKLIIVILIILLFMVRCSTQLPLPEQVKEFTDKTFDENSINKNEVPEETENPDIDPEIMFCMDMNIVPKFENGKSEGSLQIINDERNIYNMYVEIYIVDEDGKMFLSPIYSSGLIAPGNVIWTDTLDVNLPAGIYKAKAVFHGVDRKTNELKGYSNMNIEILVKNTVAD